MKKTLLSSGLMAALALIPATLVSAQQIPPTIPAPTAVAAPVGAAPANAPGLVNQSPYPAAPANTELSPLQQEMLRQQQAAAQQAAQQAAQAQQYPQPQYGQPQYPQPQYGQPQYGQPIAAPQAPMNVSAPPQLPPSALPPLPSDFELGSQQNLLMTPAQIRELRRMLDGRQQAAAELPNPPRSVTGSVSVSLDPGSTPAVIRPFYGVVTSLVLLDSTGAPWPVENFTVGNKNLFEVERLDGATGSSFVISTLQPYGQSNLIIKLAGHPTPVVVNLVSGQKIHDARVEARVLGRGPNAQVTSMSLAPGVDSRLLSVLDGVPPAGRSLKVNGDSASRAWLMPDGSVWLRTALSITAPAPISFVSSSDRTHVYKLSPTSKILGMLNGQFVTLELEGCLQECGTGNVDSQGWDH